MKPPAVVTATCIRCSANVERIDAVHEFDEIAYHRDAANQEHGQGHGHRVPVRPHRRRHTVTTDDGWDALRQLIEEAEEV